MRVSGDLCLMADVLASKLLWQRPTSGFRCARRSPTPSLACSFTPAGNSTIGKSDSIPSSLVSLSSMNSIGSAHADRPGAPAHPPA
jgi:hypothetical protein